jgi:N-acetylglucosaminyldiphosphoundecaprenol N-acetyl-beta-D-mannosaminyltransferase
MMIKKRLKLDLVDLKAKKIKILGMKICATSYKDVCEKVIENQKNHGSIIVNFANVHMVMTAFDNHGFRKIINTADIVTPDGMPLVWTLKLKGYKDQERVYGPTLTLKLLPILEDNGVPIGFFGSTPDVLERLLKKIKQEHPHIHISYAFSPPFRELDEQENREIVDDINKSGVRVLFVGLGCPKQEIWMYENRDKIKAVMLGVGAAFDFIAGAKSQAPSWIQKIGMEWFYRLITEPKRLWKRYFYNNPRFIIKVIPELLRGKKP